MNTKVTRTLKALTISVMLIAGLLTTNLTNAAEVIFISLEKPGDTLNKTHNVKFKGDIEGLVEGNKYRIIMQVIQVEGSDYSQKLEKTFTVEGNPSL